jgi:fumarylacetoacetate (FAA) hydrolase
MIADGMASTPSMIFEDTIWIEMLDGDGRSIFGLIDQFITQVDLRKSKKAGV